MIFCDNCLQLSPTLVVAYLIKYGKMSIQEAIGIVRSKVSNVFIPNIKYLIILELFFTPLKF
jgi:protein-tyrosine phosphatase